MFTDFVVVITHARAAPPQPKITESACAGCVIPQIGVAKTAKGMETTLLDSKPAEHGVKGAAQDIALADWFSISGLKDVAAFAVPKELQQPFRYFRVKVNNPVGVGGLGALSTISPNGLIDFNATPIEVSGFKP